MKQDFGGFTNKLNVKLQTQSCTSFIEMVNLPTLERNKLSAIPPTVQTKTYNFN